MLEDTFDIGEISHAINRLKCGKATGLDKLQPEHIKYGGHTLVVWLNMILI